MSKVTEYIDNLFYLMPRTNAAAEMRQKLIESSEDKYEALLSWGRSEEEALGIVVGEFGSMEEICEELGVYPMGLEPVSIQRSSSIWNMHDWAKNLLLGFQVGLSCAFWGCWDVSFSRKSSGQTCWLSPRCLCWAALERW